MWVLPSRGRPHNLARLAAAWRATGASTPVLVRLDDDDPTAPEAAAVAARAGWVSETGPRLPLAALYNEAFHAHTRETWHGFLADDVVPETLAWDTALIETAGCDGMAVPAGGETTGGCPHFVLGGDLVRSVGWLALPGLSRLFIDTAWATIARERGVYRYRPDIMLRHIHFSTGAPFDDTYRKPRKAEDRAVWRAWLARDGHKL